jgi:hypothetical protein
MSLGSKGMGVRSVDGICVYEMMCLHPLKNTIGSLRWGSIWPLSIPDRRYNPGVSGALFRPDRRYNPGRPSGDRFAVQ